MSINKKEEFKARVDAAMRLQEEQDARTPNLPTVKEYVQTHRSLQVEGSSTMSEVWAQINQAIRVMGFHLDEYCHGDHELRGGDERPMPRTFHWCVFAVEGGSEGYYVHVGVVTMAPSPREAPRYLSLGLIKVWSWERAHQITNWLSEFVHAW